MEKKVSKQPSVYTWLSRGTFQYGAIFGALVAILTDSINASDFSVSQVSSSDSLVLYFYLFILYAALGGLAAIPGHIVTVILYRFFKIRLGTVLIFAYLWLTPLLIILILPDVGIISPRPYEYFWHATGTPEKIAYVIVIGAILTLVSLLLQAAKVPLEGFLSIRTLNVSLFVCGGVVVVCANTVIRQRVTAIKTLKPAQIMAEGSVHPLVVIGIDGLGIDAVNKLSDEEIPSLKEITSNGCYFSLDGSFPGLTPQKWPVITTGEDPSKTGIHYFYRYKLPGMSGHVQRWPLETFTSLTSLIFVDKYIDIAEPLYCEQSLKAEPVWTKLQKLGGSATTICWPNSRNCSDQNLARINVCPQNERNYAKKANKITDATISAIKEGRDLIMVYFSRLDSVSHKNCAEFKDTGPVRDTLISLDKHLSKIVEALPESGAVMIVSDHGYDYSICTHILGVPGVALIRGKGETKISCIGEGEELSLRSVVPTILNLLNLRPAAPK